MAAIPSLTLQLDFSGAKCYCCIRKDSDDNTTMVVVGNTIRPRTCWEKVFCCYNRNKDWLRGKEAVKRYYESTYDSATATSAFAEVKFSRTDSISLAESRRIKQRADQLWDEKAQARHTFLKEQIEDHRPSFVFKDRSEEEKRTEPLLTLEELRQEKKLVCHTLKKVQFPKPITEIQIEEIVNRAMQNVSLENSETVTMKKFQLKVVEQLKNEGYVVARSPRSPRIPTYQPPTPTPSPHNDQA